jgi:hypothetical protein
MEKAKEEGLLSASSLESVLTDFDGDGTLVHGHLKYNFGYLQYPFQYLLLLCSFSYYAYYNI